MHSAVRTGGGDVERGEISVIHQFEIGVVVADEVARHHLRDAFGSRVAASQRAIALHLEKVGRETREDDFAEHLGQHGHVADASAFRLNLKAKALQGLAVGSAKMLIQLDIAVAGEILVRGETSECVVYGIAAALMITLHIGDVGGLFNLAVFSHGLFLSASVGFSVVVLFGDYGIIVSPTYNNVKGKFYTARCKNGLFLDRMHKGIYRKGCKSGLQVKKRRKSLCKMTV